jgi:hypothetical protein
MRFLRPVSRFQAVQPFSEWVESLKVRIVYRRRGGAGLTADISSRPALPQRCQSHKSRALILKSRIPRFQRGKFTQTIGLAFDRHSSPNTL